MFVNAGTRKKWLIGSGLVAVACGGIWLATTRREDEPAATPKASAKPLACRFTKDAQQTFELALEVRSKVDSKHLLPTTNGVSVPIQDQRAGMKGKLHLRVLEVEAREATLAFWLEPSQDSITANLTPAELAQIKQPVVIKTDSRCEFTSYGFAADVGPSARNQLRGIVQSAQVVLPKDAKEQAWKHLEYDLAGRYGATYTRLPDAERSVRKVKFGYLDVFPPQTSGSTDANAQSAPLSARVRDSDTLAVWAVDGSWLEELASVERLLFMTGENVFADVSTKLVLKRLPQASVPTAEPALTDLVWLASNQPPDAKQDDEFSEPPEEFKGMTLDQALAQVDAILRADPKNHAGMGQFLALLMRAQPALIPELMARVRSGSIRAELHSAFFFGLERTGTPEARTALVEALDDKTLQADNRMRAAAALADIPHPDEVTLLALSNLSKLGTGLKDASAAQRLTNSATFAIGTIERNMRNKNPALAEKARDSIRLHLREAKNDAVKITAALDAIHNSGHPDFIPDLQPHFASDKLLVRKHAYEAMTRMPVESTAPLFESLLSKEGEPQQRALLAITFADQARTAQVAPPRNVWGAAASKLVDESHTAVRASYVHLIGGAANSSPEATAALAEQYHRETDPRMLKAIGRYVPADKLTK